MCTLVRDVRTLVAEKDAEFARTIEMIEEVTELMTESKKTGSKRKAA